MLCSVKAAKSTYVIAGTQFGSPGLLFTLVSSKMTRLDCLIQEHAYAGQIK